jgi:phosphosulfolactate phosphohydrolase-like enzyme
MTGFSKDWWASAEPATTLGQRLGTSAEEFNLGPSSADILAKDTEGNFVVIENQFGKTDHDHLGKLLTYAATLNASAVVWIAERFTDEHRKAFEWLNDHASEDLSLYAVERVLWQIDQSKPLFNSMF